MKAAPLSLAALALLLAQTALAHGVWTEKRYGHLEVVYGHGAEDEAYAPDRIKAVHAYDGNGGKIAVTVERLTDHVRLRPMRSPALLTLAFDNGIWSKDKSGKSVNAPMADVAGAVSASHSYKYSLAILQSPAKVPNDLKLPMMIRPLKDPQEIGVGNPLPVQVTIDGKPAAHVALLDDYRGMSDVSSVKTDREGRASIVIRNAGLNIIAAQARVPVEAADGVIERSLFTSLTFVGEAHHD